MLKFAPALRDAAGELLGPLRSSSCIKTPVATLKYYAPPADPSTIKWPEERKLKMMEKRSPLWQGKLYTMPKRLSLIRGPEPIHNFLLYKQYGLQAVTGGRMKYENFEFFRKTFLKIFDYNRTFALWRIEAPWQPVSKKGAGKRMGGGKGPIHHYVTPVKAGRIILEVGGILDPKEMAIKLAPLAENLPFPARYVTHDMLEKEKEREKWEEENNANPYTMKYVMLNNLGGCQNWMSKYDYKWFGKYR